MGEQREPLCLRRCRRAGDKLVVPSAGGTRRGLPVQRDTRSNGHQSDLHCASSSAAGTEVVGIGAVTTRDALYVMARGVGA